MEDKFSYNEAVAELETILRTLQSDKCDIDAMVDLTKRATTLIKQCRERLTATESELKNILDNAKND